MIKNLPADAQNQVCRFLTVDDFYSVKLVVPQLSEYDYIEYYRRRDIDIVNMAIELNNKNMLEYVSESDEIFNPGHLVNILARNQSDNIPIIYDMINPDAVLEYIIIVDWVFYQGSLEIYKRIGYKLLEKLYDSEHNIFLKNHNLIDVLFPTVNNKLCTGILNLFFTKNHIEENDKLELLKMYINDIGHIYKQNNVSIIRSYNSFVHMFISKSRLCNIFTEYIISHYPVFNRLTHNNKIFYRDTVELFISEKSYSNLYLIAINNIDIIIDIVFNDNHCDNVDLRMLNKIYKRMTNGSYSANRILTVMKVYHSYLWNSRYHLNNTLNKISIIVNFGMWKFKPKDYIELAMRTRKREYLIFLHAHGYKASLWDYKKYMKSDVRSFLYCQIYADIFPKIAVLAAAANLIKTIIK